MATVQLMKERNEALGLKASNDFGNSVIRSVDQLGYSVGQEFTIPTDFTGIVYNEPVRVGGVVQGTAQYILIQDKAGQGVRFYPSSLAKMALICDDKGMLTGERKVASGTAAEEYQKHAKVQDGMNALKGKTLRVDELTPCQVRRSATDSTPRNTFIPTINIVGLN